MNVANASLVSLEIHMFINATKETNYNIEYVFLTT